MCHFSESLGLMSVVPSCISSPGTVCIMPDSALPQSQFPELWALIVWSLRNLWPWLLTLSLGAAHFFQLIVLFSEDLLPAFNL